MKIESIESLIQQAFQSGAVTEISATGTIVLPTGQSLLYELRVQGLVGNAVTQNAPTLIALRAGTQATAASAKNTKPAKNGPAKKKQRRQTKNTWGGRRAGAGRKHVYRAVAAPAPTPSRRTRGASDPRHPAPGTVLEREWRGQIWRVKILADKTVQTLHDNRIFTTLSRAGQHITGQKISGYVWFGLDVRARDRRRRAQRAG